ncbi:MAG TPA: LysR substrate-binding domain-containing protein [Burkholderiales bacterium]|nr:LysR substrate-binding domain-containing protein [Burkholderiales bacterium]
MPPAARILPDWYLRSRLKMRQVLLLVALDEQRNMHRAAASLRMTQPAATRLLGGLERMLGMKLFERGPRGLTPNAYGESLVRHARAMLATLDHAREEMNALAEGAAGRIALGALLVAAPVLVPLALARFKERHPNHTVLVREGSATALLPALRRGELDLVVGRVTSDVPGDGLEFEAFYREPMTVVARVGHPLARRRALKLRELVGEAWIFPAPEAPYRRRLDAAFQQAGVAPPRRLVESVSVAVNKMLVQKTDMLGVMPRDVAREYAVLGLLRILPVRLPPPSGPVGVITATGRPLPPGGAELIQALREAARQRR